MSTSSIVIDNLFSHLRTGQAVIGIACLYCDYRDQDNQSLQNIITCFLSQLLATVTKFPDEAATKLDSMRKENRRPEIKDALSLLKLVMQQYDCIFICIDALDELAQRTRIQLLEALHNLNTARIFLTGRHHIQEEVSKWLQLGSQESITISANMEDIRLYLEEEIKVDWNDKAMDQKLKDEIVDIITKMSEGM